MAFFFKSTHPRKFGSQPTDRPSVRTTGIPMFTLALSSYFGSQEKADCTSMLWSIDSCQNLVSADQYHLTVAWAQVSTHQEVILKLSADNLLVFKWSKAQFFFKIHIKYVVFMSLSPSTITILISNWPQTQKFSQFFLKYRRARPFLTMVTCWSRSTSNF